MIPAFQSAGDQDSGRRNPCCRGKERHKAGAGDHVQKHAEIVDLQTDIKLEVLAVEQAVKSVPCLQSSGRQR